MITVSFAAHRPETISLGYAEMLRNDVIILEEPSQHGFTRMLDNAISISEYFLDSDIEYPEYGRSMARVLQKLHRKGKKIYQVEPYLDRLYQIHEHFAHGKTPDDIMRDSKLAPVYRAEKKATACLIQYYQKSVKGPFDELVDSLINFARADAHRIALRDQLRAMRIAEMWSAELSKSEIYVESGYIHFGLFKSIRRLLASQVRIQPFYVLEQVVRPLLGKKQVLGPGDLLTLLFMFKKNISVDIARLLAVRSLIYIKLLTKDEIIPENENDFPHTYDEIRALKMVNNLDMEDCHELFRRIHFQNPGKCVQMVKAYLMSG